jgi:sulfide dehydrogenase cytochrome subunit
MKWRALLVVASLAAGSMSSASAATPDGASLADGCTSCHGLNGRSSGAIPSIAGADRARLVAMLQAFRSQSADATIMNRLARSYNDAEIEALADYFSRVGKR